MRSGWRVCSHVWTVDREPIRFVRDGRRSCAMIDDQDLGFFANFLGIFIFILVIAYHYVMADPKYEGSQC
ncbi:Oligosaccaryltransferase [Musa troglodytarum]|uniref:Oligosaccaryltransferase n=1 Tax=Musa troglodytarum TaxID=320322 RepID=A0A9E7L2C2_9LILI|nr:Oligosaccaryltransferase [Musa troglodytarum]URE35361.1 Oligosaccaryltransferase [Musa troglodytarum]